MGLKSIIYYDEDENELYIQGLEKKVPLKNNIIDWLKDEHFLKTINNEYENMLDKDDPKKFFMEIVNGMYDYAYTDFVINRKEPQFKKEPKELIDKFI